MQIVIDIDKKFYEIAFSDSNHGIALGALQALRSGIVLPEKHGRLIDAEKFAMTIKQISEEKGYDKLDVKASEVIDAVVSELTGTALYGYANNPTVIRATGDKK